MAVLGAMKNAVIQVIHTTLFNQRSVTEIKSYFKARDPKNKFINFGINGDPGDQRSVIRIIALSIIDKEKTSRKCW